MNRIFSNGPSGDFVINPFSSLASNSSTLCVASPYVTETGDLLASARSGVAVKLLVGLNASTDPRALSQVHGLPNLAIRYLTRRFHAKMYIADTVALVGSSNLTDGGLRSNREATVRLDHLHDADALEELRALFLELWNSGDVLTTEKLSKFEKTYALVKHPGANADAIIEGAVGKAEPVNISVASRKNTSERLFLEGLRRQVYEEYRPAFNEVTALLEQNKLRRSELEDVGIANETNRYLNWVRLTYVVGDEAWQNASIRPQQERREIILRLGNEWANTDETKIPKDYIDWLHRVREVFGTAESIDGASKEELTEALLSVHAVNEQLRFVKGGRANLPHAFWHANHEDISKVKRTFAYLLHGPHDFIRRLHDVLYGAEKIAYFGKFCSLELYGTIKPEDCPPINGRMAKALRFLGFDVLAN